MFCTLSGPKRLSERRDEDDGLWTEVLLNDEAETMEIDLEVDLDLLRDGLEALKEDDIGLLIEAEETTDEIFQIVQRERR